MLRVLCKHVWIDVCLQSVHESSERTVKCRMHVLAGTRRMSVVCDVHAWYAEKRQIGLLTDEWGVTAAAQVDRASVRAGGGSAVKQCRLAVSYDNSLLRYNLAGDCC